MILNIFFETFSTKNVKSLQKMQLILLSII